jgi:2-polyprenyl-6-methoxyphenol hydroxylase-like FAD-dependent oxidoreductase
MERSMKIAINGAGVAGPALAYWLRRSGHEPTLIEKSPHFRSGGYIIDFWGVGYTVAEKMGILPEIKAEGYSVEEVRFVDHHGRKVGGFDASVFLRMTHDRFTSLPRGDLAATIYHAIGDGVETIFGDSISAIEEHGDGVRTGFETGATRDFDLVIGADGLHSRVRELVFGSEAQFETQLGYRVAAFETVGYRPRDELVYVSYAIPGRQVSRFAMRDDRTLFLLVFAAEYMAGPEPDDADQSKALLRRVYGDAGWETPEILKEMDKVEEIYFDRVSQIRMERWSKGRVMLIGDAASAVSLLAGEGTGLGLTEAYVLAGELARAGGDYDTAFRRHEERLRPFIEGKQKSAANFASAFAPKTGWGVWLRNQFTKLLVIPPVADFLIGRDLRDDFELPDYGM